MARRRSLQNVTKRRVQNGKNKCVEIYGGVVAIMARKGKGSKYPGKLFEHRFASRPKMYGLPDGSLLITHRRPRR